MKHLLVDGENLKGKIKYLCDEVFHVEHPQWNLFNFPKMFESSLGSRKIDRVVFYFAKIKIHQESIQKSKELIEEQRLLKTALESFGYEVVLAGSVRGNPGPNGRMVFKEKGVDVRIAVDMIAMSCDKISDEIVLCSSDSDLQPAIAEATKRGTPIVYLGFGISPNKGLTHTTKETILIRDDEVRLSLPITLL